MGTRRLALVLCLVGAFLLGCSSDGGEGTQEQPTPKVGKGDCPDCDPAGPSAFEQAQMGLRFYATGDQWQLAWQFKVRNDMVRESIRELPDDPTELPTLLEDGRVEISQPYLFQYEVLSVEERKLENVMRDVALIEVGQAAQAPAEFSAQRLDRHQHKLQFELDDLLRPLKEIYYSREYPHGKAVEVDSVASLSGLERGVNLFPHAVPRVLVAAPASDIPALTPELEAIADKMMPGWRSFQFMKYQFENGDVVYWAKGYVWPFYMDSQQGFGLLVGQTLAAR